MLDITDDDIDFINSVAAGEEIQSYQYSHPVRGPSVDPLCPDHFFPLQKACYRIANVMFLFHKGYRRSANGTHNELCCLADLYLALETQYEIDCPMGSEDNMFKLNWLSEWFGAAKFLGVDGWQQVTESEVIDSSFPLPFTEIFSLANRTGSHSVLCRGDPWDMTNTTTIILSYVKPIPVTTVVAGSLADRVQNLAPEIRRMILKEVGTEPFDELPRDEQTPIYDQSDWFEMFLSNFPWLWDLDRNRCHHKGHEGSWDWEGLVRRLSHANVLEPSGYVEECQMG